MKSAMRGATVCYSVGYQGRDLDDLCDELSDEGVQILFDVRDVPWSQRPEFRKQHLASRLREHGIDYVHVKEVGNPFRPRTGQVSTVAQCARAYRSHLDRNPEAVRALSDAARGRRSAVLCFEHDHGNCHRSVLLALMETYLGSLQIELL